MLNYLRYSALIMVLIAYISKAQLLVLGSVFIYIIWFLYNKKFLMKYLYVVFLIFTNILGVYSIEYSSIFLYELEQTSKLAYSLAPIVLVHLIFVEVLIIFDHIFENKIKANKIYFSKSTLNIISLFSSIILIGLFLKVIGKPYFLLGYDRFAYQKNVLNDFQEKIGNLLLYFMPIFYISLKSNKKLGLVTIVLFNIYFLWIGHKFSIFMMAFQLGLLVIYTIFTNKKLNKYLFMIGILITFFITAVFIQNYLVREMKFADNINYLKSRLAQQGQLWWGVYKEKEYHKFHLIDAEKETKLFFISDADNNSLKYDLGMYKTMKLVAPKKRVDFKIRQGSSYSYSTQANLLYYFNYPILLIITVIMAFFLSLITNLLIKFINEGNFITIILFSKLYITYIRFLTNSGFYTIFSYETIVIISGSLITIFLLNKFKLNNRIEKQLNNIIGRLNIVKKLIR